MKPNRVRGGKAAKTRLHERKITAGRLRALFTYDPETGELLRGGAPVHRVARPSGRYLRVTVDGVILAQHRVIWCMVTGSWPEDEVDHIDRDTRNNRWSNLRAATVQQQNRWAAAATGATGQRGVSVRGDKYRVRIGNGARGRRLSCGDFGSLDEAVAARNIVETALWGARPSSMKVPSRRLTDVDASVVKTLLSLGWMQSDIASLMTINLGRVSEISTGQKFRRVLPADLNHPETLAVLRQIQTAWLLRVGSLIDRTVRAAA